MPHTRAAQLRALEAAAEVAAFTLLQNSPSTMGGNEYPDWDQPELTYQPHPSAWLTCEGAATYQPRRFIDTQPLVAYATNSVSEPNSETASKSNFCGLQPWYSAGMQEFPSISHIMTTRSQLSGGELSSYESTSLDEGSQPTDQSCVTQPWSPTSSCQLSSVSGETFGRGPSKSPTIDLTQELDKALSYSSEEEDARRTTSRDDASKKRKTAHSAIEKRYRSRINEGMAELRHCVPSTATSSSSLDSKRPQRQRSGDYVAPIQPSGKVATLSDAVHYVKALEFENEGLHGQLDLLERRNNTLQMIALSKGITMAPATSIKMEARSGESTSRPADQQLVALQSLKERTSLVERP